MQEENPKRPVVVITGASGLIGTRTARALASDYTLVGLDVVKLPPDFPEGSHFVECDLSSDESTRRAVQQVRDALGPRVASVVHLAAYYDFSGAPSPLYQELTVDGTRRLVRAVREQLESEQLVFSSSLLVMQPSDGERVLDEGSPVQAEWDYPRSKLDAEAVLQDEHGDLPVVVLRIAGAYDEDGHSPPITQQIWRIREKKLESFLFPGNRSHGQSFVHLDDVARCLRATVDRRRDLDPWEIFLVGEPEVMSYGELQDGIGELVHGREWPTLRIPAPVAKAGAWVKDRSPVGGEQFIKPWMIDLADAHYPISIDRARERLGWQPEHRLRDTLPRMIERLKDDPEGFYEENELPGEGDDGPLGK